MMYVTIKVSANRKGRPLDAAEVAHWVGESLSNPDTLDTGSEVVVHSLSVEEEDA